MPGLVKRIIQQLK